MDKRAHIWLSVQTGLGIALAGLGHYYASAWREVYPLDGYVYYFLAALAFGFAWRTARAEPSVSSDFQWHRPASWQALKQIPARAVVIAAVVLNMAAAFIALLFSAALVWGLLWGLSALALFFTISRSSLLQPATEHPPVEQQPVAPAVTTRTYAEAAQPIGGQVNRIGLAISIGLLLIGSIMAGTLVRSNEATGSIAQTINDSLRLDLIGDPAVVLSGALGLALGTIGYALATRKVGLHGYPPLVLTEVTVKAQRAQWVWSVAALLATLLWLATLGALSGTDDVGWNGVLPFIASLILMGACWWQIDRVRGVRHGVHLSRREVLSLSTALIAILLLCVFQLGDIPNSIWGDEGAFFVTAREVARGAAAPDAFGLGTYALPMPGAVYQGGWLALLGVNLAAWRFASVFAAWLALIPLYFLVRSTLGRRVAWVSLALYATLPYLLTYARMGYDVALGLAPVTAALALIWIAVRRDSGLYVFLAGCVAALGFYTTPSARIALILVPLWLLWMWITRQVRGRTIGRQLLTVLLGVLIVAAPPLVRDWSRAPDIFAGKQVESAFNNLFYARDFFPQDQLTTNGDPIPIGNQQLINAPELYGPLLARGVLRTALALHAGSLVHEHYLLGALADPLGVLYLLGVGWCLARFRRPGYVIWPLWLFVGGFLTSALSAYPPRAALLVPMIPTLVVLGALGVVSGSEVLALAIGSVNERVARYAIVGVTALLMFVGVRAYFVEMPQRFPSDLSNALFWQAQSLPRGSSEVLILPDTWPKDYAPWGLKEFDLEVQFHALTKIDLNTADWNGLCPVACRVFFAASDRDLVMSYLAQAFGDQPLVEYPDMLGSVQAYMFVAK